ncbi:MAG: hypothetical protein JWN48_5157 [Myxococcaceae bacterium]|nr:hypothetical protein [Myxococcaceae bacterium]
MRVRLLLASAFVFLGCEEVQEDGCAGAASSSGAAECHVACAVGEARSMTSGRCEAAACTIEMQVATATSSEKTVDCGNLPVSASDVQREQAHRCLREAASAGRPFRLIEWLQGVDSQTAYGFTSGGAGSRIMLFEYDSLFSAFSSTGGAAIGAATCSAVVAVPGCQASSLATCLDCLDASAPVEVCELPPAR